MDAGNMMNCSRSRRCLLPEVLALLCCLAGSAGVCLADDPPRAQGASPRITISLEPIDTPSVVPPAPTEYPLDLQTALELAGVENPTIALAQEAVQASLAEQLQARALLLPTLDAGASLDVHRGNLQSAHGIIRDVNRQSLYVGAGASAVGAGTVTIPGARITAHLADAIFEPQAARQQVTAARFDAMATRNAILLDVTTRYFALVGTEAQLLAVRQTETEFGEVARLTANFAKIGQGQEGDAERARARALLLHTEEEHAEEEVAAAAAELARLLNLDPSYRLRVKADLIPVVQLFDPHEDLERLLQIAVQNRPEIGAATAAIAVAATHLRQEQVRPFVPLLSVGYSAGGFGGGSNLTDTRFGHFADRTDFDALAVWSLENVGLGNLAVQRQRRAAVNEAQAERLRILNLIRREVTEAQALSAARLRQIAIARLRVETAQEGFRLDMLRAQNLRGRVIEILNSLILLSTARQDLVRALIEYDQAQFQLFVSLGQPPTLASAGSSSCPR